MLSSSSESYDRNRVHSSRLYCGHVKTSSFDHTTVTFNTALCCTVADVQDLIRLRNEWPAMILPEQSEPGSPFHTCLASFSASMGDGGRTLCVRMCSQPLGGNGTHRDNKAAASSLRLLKSKADGLFNVHADLLSCHDHQPLLPRSCHTPCPREGSGA